MTTHFMRSYSKLCIKTCHRRNVSAMGGMSAFIPIKSDPEANERALAGSAPTRNAKPPTATTAPGSRIPASSPSRIEVFDRVMPQPNQIDKQLPDYNANAADLLASPHRHHHRSRPQAERRRRPRLCRGMAARHRLRPALQPHGRRRHRRDQPRTALAVGASRRQAL